MAVPDLKKAGSVSKKRSISLGSNDIQERIRDLRGKLIMSKRRLWRGCGHVLGRSVPLKVRVQEMDGRLFQSALRVEDNDVKTQGHDNEDVGEDEDEEIEDGQFFESSEDDLSEQGSEGSL
ncbi:hypothetical protein L1887_26175 [Cichorium endivia]|nr:hypothetical protein L1887_26175 [Cichorium endivia]